MEDAEIVRLVQAGDTDAFALLEKKYHGLVFHIAYESICNYEDAEDLVQEIFLKIFVGIRTWTPVKEFAAWVRVVANYACVDHLRFCNRVIRRRSVCGDVDFSTFQDSSADPCEMAEYTELWNRLREAVSVLPRRERQTFVLMLNGYGEKETAKLMGVTDGTRKAALHKARAKMKVALSEFREGICR